MELGDSESIDLLLREEDARRALGDILSDESDWAGLPYVERVEFDDPDVPRSSRVWLQGACPRFRVSWDARLRTLLRNIRRRSHGLRLVDRGSVTFSLLAVAVGLAAASASVSKAQVTRSSCGVELWSLKTLSDPQRNLVNLRPRNTSVLAINRLRMPVPTPTTRSTRFARQVWRVKAQIVQYKLEDDFDIHLILFAQGKYLIAEMPLAGCLPRTTRDRAAIAAARARFEGRCGSASAQWRNLGAVALISGVGFWDFPHGQSGHARNYSELHPVTGLKLLAGCGA